MCEICDEAKGLRDKDRDMLEVDRHVELTMRHGIRVRVNLLKFKAEERSCCELSRWHSSKNEDLHAAIPRRLRGHIPG